MAVVVASLDGQSVLLGPGGLEGLLEPVGVGAVVVELLQGSVDVSALAAHEVDILLCVGDVSGNLSEELVGELGSVGYGRPAVVAGSALGGDEDYAVTGLRSVDGCGSGVLQDLHALDHFRVEIVDVENFKTVNDEERSDVSAVG